MRLTEGELASWIQERRWYATKNSQIQNLSFEVTSTFDLGVLEVQHLVVTIDTQSGQDRYQLLVSSQDTEYVQEQVSPDSVIASGEFPVFEVMGDRSALVHFAELFDQKWSDSHLQFHSKVSLESINSTRIISTEQSNSSVIFGDRGIAKFYRRLTPGMNPDLEIGTELDRLNCQFVPHVLGWVEGNVAGMPTTLCVMHQFFNTAIDGFEHALSSVRDLIATDAPPEESGGDFFAEATRLGEAVAAVHSDLKTAFGDADVQSDVLIAEMLQRLDRAVSEVPALGEFKAAIAARYAAARDQRIAVQRIHGDLHLGQVLRDPSGWKILDFEGEPGSTLDERRAMGSALRDVAGMLRSFDYAARQPLITHPDKDRLVERTSKWAERNRVAFLEGYGAIADPLILEIYELDKAVYEALYEHRFRPDWIDVPLGGIERLMHTSMEER